MPDVAEAWDHAEVGRRADFTRCYTLLTRSASAVISRSATRRGSSFNTVRSRTSRASSRQTERRSY